MYNDSVLTNDVLISQAIANLLHLEVGDRFLTYFITDPVRARKFKVRGIYQTTFADYDNLFLITDIRHIQTLNHWDTTQMSQLEILVDDFSKVDEVETGVCVGEIQKLLNLTQSTTSHYLSMLEKDNLLKIFPSIKKL